MERKNVVITYYIAHNSRDRCEKGNEIREIPLHIRVKIHHLIFFIDKFISDLTRHQIVNRLTNNNF